MVLDETGIDCAWWFMQMLVGEENNLILNIKGRICKHIAMNGCTPGNSKFSRMLGIGRSVLLRHLLDLERSGMIVRKVGSYRRSVYVFSDRSFLLALEYREQIKIFQEEESEV